MPVIDPNHNARFILEGRIVTMNAQSDVLDRGRICVSGGTIEAVLQIGDALPAGFQASDIIKVGGTIYPGMIELHNHLPYNILPYWIADRAYGNHSQWKGKKAYRTFITGPMQTLGRTDGFPAAIVRYTECKCLLSGVTTSQGWTLANSQLRKRYYHGLIRNVEETNEDSLPEAAPRIADVTDAAGFLASLRPDRTRLLHLSEGIDDRARSFFTNLQIDDLQWAITDRLAGIHCTGMTAEDFEIFTTRGGSMVWSPMSNLILYGATANIEAAKQHSTTIALGADWSPSGSKNLLEELKVAYLVSKHISTDGNPVFSPEELVRMVTSNPAQILGWQNALGSIEAGKKADFIVLRNYQDDPYEKLIHADENDITLTIINGIPRCGQQRLIRKFGIADEDTEAVTIKNVKRCIYLAYAQEDPILQGLTLAQAQQRLEQGLANIGDLARQLENASLALFANGSIDSTSAPFLISGDGALMAEGWSLIPDYHDDHFAGKGLDLDHGDVLSWGAGVNFSDFAVPLPLDGLTVLDDNYHFEQLSRQPNIPDYIRQELPDFYGRRPLEYDALPFSIPSGANDGSTLLPIPLETFLKTSSNLKRSEKLTIVDQAILLLENIYVHLPLKRSMYAANPLEKLRVIRNNLQVAASGDTLPDDNAFHREMLAIFGSLRDLHTNYMLPTPYKYRFAYLPFMVEEAFIFSEDEEPIFLVTKVLDGVADIFPNFQPGIRLLSWNFAPIDGAVTQNAIRQSGSNAAARWARGIDTLTIRPLSTNAVPEERKILLTYQKPDSDVIYEATFEWMISHFPPTFSEESTAQTAAMLASGLDYQTNAVNNVKAIFFRGKEGKDWFRPRSRETQGLMRATVLKNPKDDSRYGYIRIFSFAINSSDPFVDAFRYLFNKLEQKGIKGLILDIRGNGGGLITASEKLLALLTGSGFKAQNAQFINSDLTLEICRRHGKDSPFVDLSAWYDSISLSRQTGDIYSLGFPITEVSAKRIERGIYDGPMVLITDALCYSAADIFAAGFKDHRLGTVLGVHENTGAGGANVWRHSVLRLLLDHNRTPADGPNPFVPLPKGAGMRMAVRRTLRQGVERRGLPVEDLGIRPDELHKMTVQDIMGGNEKLLNKAFEIIDGMDPENPFEFAATFIGPEIEK